MLKTSTGLSYITAAHAVYTATAPGYAVHTAPAPFVENILPAPVFHAAPEPRSCVHFTSSRCIRHTSAGRAGASLQLLLFAQHQLPSWSACTSPEPAGTYAAPALEVYAAPALVLEYSLQLQQLRSPNACRMCISPAPVCLLG